jgi:hypothetical protein
MLLGNRNARKCMVGLILYFYFRKLVSSEMETVGSGIVRLDIFANFNPSGYNPTNCNNLQDFLNDWH